MLHVISLITEYWPRCENVIWLLSKRHECISDTLLCMLVSVSVVCCTDNSIHLIAWSDLLVHGRSGRGLRAWSPRVAAIRQNQYRLRKTWLGEWWTVLTFWMTCESRRWKRCLCTPENNGTDLCSRCLSDTVNVISKSKSFCPFSVIAQFGLCRTRACLKWQVFSRRSLHVKRKGYMHDCYEG